MGMIYLGILLCSIAFAIAVIYISFVLKRLSNTIGSMGKTLGEVEKELQYITPQLKQTIREADKAVDDMAEKVKATDGLFDSIGDVGVSIDSLNQAYDNSIKKLSPEQFEKKTKPFVEGIKWSEAALFLYSKWKKEKPAEAKNDNIITVNQTGKEG